MHIHGNLEPSHIHVGTQYHIKENTDMYKNHIKLIIPVSNFEQVGFECRF